MTEPLEHTADYRIEPLVLDYSSHDGRPIQLDLFDYRGEASDSPRPAVIFLHGGKLVAGNRRSLVPHFLHTLCVTQKWILISADHRLLVPASGQDMLDDMIALFRYITTDIDMVKRVDARRIAIYGSSAGAYPARLAAFYAKPRPRAVVLAYGRGGDLLNDTYLSPPQPLPPALEAQISHLLPPYPTNISPSTFSESEPEAEPAVELRHEWDIAESDPFMCTPLSTHDRARSSRALWEGLMLQGIALDYITGVKGANKVIREAIANSSESFEAGERDALLVNAREADILCLPSSVLHPSAHKLLPQLALALSTPSSPTSYMPFPPTYLLHGSADTSVLPSESERTYAQLRALGVDVRLRLVQGQGHGFDWGREEEAGVKEELQRVEEFLREYLDS